MTSVRAVVVHFAVSAFGIALGCGNASAGPVPDRGAIEVRLGTVQHTTITDSSDYIATLKSRRSVTLQPQVDGQIARIFVKSGDVVKRGALLMQLDPSRQLHSVNSQRAGAVAKQAALNYALQEHKRIAALFQGGAASQQELDQAKSALDSAQADVDSLGAQVREGEVQLHYFSIEAPEAGAVGDIPVREGDYVTPQTKLTTIDQNEQLELYVSVPVERAGEMHVNQRVALVDDEGKHLADSFVTFVSSQVDEETQSVLVKTVVPNLHNTLRTAQFVRARVIFDEHEGPAIPSQAVKRLNGQSFAFAVEDQAGKLTVHQRPIQLGPLDGNLYPVLKGLNVGERIVVSGLQKLQDGAVVTPLSAPGEG